jgi:hypothetical protein
LLALPEDERFPRVWPKLKLISCWREGPSAYHAEVLSRKFPHAILQGKGLIATEGFVSFPLMEANGSLPAYRSHFLEFLGEGETDTRLVDQIDEGEAYSVILTTGGGLYRYHLRDKIEVTGKHDGIPLIRFVGRESVSDMVGEKLEETHVQRIVSRTLERHGMPVRFLLVSPEVEERGGFYVVFLELMDETAKGRCEIVAEEIEEGLRENFHYRHASDLEQVLPLRVFLIDGDGTGAYLRRCVEEGQKVGDVKHVVLDKRGGWVNRFEGNFV